MQMFLPIWSYDGVTGEQTRDPRHRPKLDLLEPSKLPPPRDAEQQVILTGAAVTQTIGSRRYFR